MSVLIQTSIGDLTVDVNVKRAPKASENFLKLCKAKHYNFAQFIRIQAGLSAELAPVQRPLAVWGLRSGAASGDSFFVPERHEKLSHKRRGTLSFSCTAGGLASSAFFITLNDPVDRPIEYLDTVHAPFAKVVEDESGVLEKLHKAVVDAKFVPFLDIRILHTIVLDDPFPEIQGVYLPERSPSPTPEIVASMKRLNNDEAAAPAIPEEELAALDKRTEATANALTLELIGDLPFADVKPPENVLFVAKLNPVTTEPDLKLIFSRFGKCSVHLVTDDETRKSLGYAFVEFDEQEAAETAFFKMDKCLIDDSRIHVDFSQSVARVDLPGHENKDKSKGQDFGGVGLRRRKLYRDDDSRYGKKYDIVLDDTIVPPGSNTMHPKDGSRDGPRSPDAARGGSPPRRERDERRRRSRSPNTVRDGSPPRRDSDYMRQRSRSPVQKDGASERRRQRSRSPPRKRR